MVCCPVFTWAQQKDFAPHYLDELIPDYKQYMFPETEFPYDSTYFTRTDSKRKLEINDSILSSNDTIIIKSYFLWNKHGKLISYRQYQDNLIHSQGIFKPALYELNVSDTLIYKHGKLLIEIDRNVGMFGSLDTLKLNYNRIHKIEEEYLANYFPTGKNEKNSTMKFFYDGQGRLKTLSNVRLRSAKLVYGTSFYDYDNTGNLCRRTIIAPDGNSWLMTDTLIYDFIDSLHEKMRTRHYFKTNLKPNWSLVDEKTENAITHVDLSYKAKRESQYEYYEMGKYKKIINRDTNNKQIVITTFSYGMENTADTIHATEISNVDGKQVVKENWNTIYIYHNRKDGLIARKEAYEDLAEISKPEKKGLRSIEYYKWE